MSNAKKLPVLQRVYAKDISFEAPNILQALSKDWKPEMHLDMNTKANRLEDKVFEIVLSLTASVKSAGQTAYVCEIQQAGIFSIEETNEDELKKILGCNCPNLLFPFAREAVSNLVARGGFPQLLLTPIDFEALYTTALAERNAAGTIRH